MASIRAALKALHVERGVPHVVISSIPLSKALAEELATTQHPSNASSIPDRLDDDGAAGESLRGESLLCIASSSSTTTTSSPSEVSMAVVPRIPGYYSGVGDLFSALVLAHFTPTAARLDSSIPSSVNGPTTRDHDATGTGCHAMTAAAAAGGGGEEVGAAEALRVAVRAALATTGALMAATDAHCRSLSEDECPATDEEKDGEDPERRVRRMRARELRIVQGLEVIRNAPAGVTVGQWEGFWG